VLNSFLDDSVRMIITSRYPDTNQLEEFKRVKGYMPQRNIIGKDALAIVAHSAHGNLKITDDELKQILLGKITKFEQLENSKISGTIKLVFNSDKSSEILYVQDSLLSGQPIGNPSVFATKNNVAVMDYVAQNKEALGIVGVSWVSDEYSDQVQKFKESVTLVQIKKDKAHYYEPHLGYIATHDYPYRKYICVTNKEGSMGLGRGFLQFMSGDIGQKIIMKAGVVPAFAQPRVLSVQD
jgi:phosphate transport system substrate-binding protein